MTNKQVDSAKKLFGAVSRHLNDEGRYSDELYVVCLEKALWCIEMIHSILVYQYNPKQDKFLFPESDEFLQQYIDILGRPLTEYLWEKQVEDFKEAEVGDAGCDFEGLRYNYCKWPDD